jgi:excinuclease UvrABC nuclease subunit
MQDLAGEMRFEDAEALNRKLDKIRRARQEYKDTFFSVWNFNVLAVLTSDSAARCKIAFVRAGRIVAFEQYDIATLHEALIADLHRCYVESPQHGSGDEMFDEFCLVSNFIVSPVLSVDLLPVHDVENLPALVTQRIQQRKKKRKTAPAHTVPG